MRILTHTVTEQEDGMPVKKLLRQHLGLSSSLLKAIKNCFEIFCICFS